MWHIALEFSAILDVIAYVSWRLTETKVLNKNLIEIVLDASRLPVGASSFSCLRARFAFRIKVGIPPTMLQHAQLLIWRVTFSISTLLCTFHSFIAALTAARKCLKTGLSLPFRLWLQQCASNHTKRLVNTHFSWWLPVGCRPVCRPVWLGWFSLELTATKMFLCFSF